MLETLQEFMVYTKGWEYLITVAFVFAFIVFWKLMSGERSH